MGEQKIKAAANERALLERAAQAGGITLLRWNENQAAYETTEGFWNARANDGDAMRLAVKLRLNVNFEEFDGAEYVCAIPHWSHQGQDQVIGDDANAATRRAIVLAAAELWKEPR